MFIDRAFHRSLHKNVKCGIYIGHVLRPLKALRGEYPCPVVYLGNIHRELKHTTIDKKYNVCDSRKTKQKVRNSFKAYKYILTICITDVSSYSIEQAYAPAQGSENNRSQEIPTVL